VDRENGRGSEGVSGKEAGGVRNTNTPAAAGHDEKKRERSVPWVGAEEQNRQVLLVLRVGVVVRPWSLRRGPRGEDRCPLEWVPPEPVGTGCSEAGAELDSS